MNDDGGETQGQYPNYEEDEGEKMNDRRGRRDGPRPLDRSSSSVSVDRLGRDEKEAQSPGLE